MSPDDLRAVRESIGFTQEQLAVAIGKHPNTIACMERGVKRITPSTAAAVEMVVALASG